MQMQAMLAGASAVDAEQFVSGLTRLVSMLRRPEGKEAPPPLNQVDLPDNVRAFIRPPAVYGDDE